MIKLILTAIHSKRDRNGNTYWAMYARDIATGKVAQGTVSGGESNISGIVRALGLDRSEVHYSVEEKGIREFNRENKSLVYAGCPSEQIADFIKKEFGWK